MVLSTEKTVKRLWGRNPHNENQAKNNLQCRSGKGITNSAFFMIRSGQLTLATP
jgi:hypothetical protein